MLHSREHSFNDCSPGVVALLRYPGDGLEVFQWGGYATVCIGGIQNPLDTFEVKTVVSRDSLDAHLLQLAKYMQMMHL